jgi:putative glycerol-1-phosphate prenyltransferase
MAASLLHTLVSARQQGKTLLGALVDPDHGSDETLIQLAQHLVAGGADLILVGGSLVTHHRQDHVVKTLKALTGKPVLLFPGSMLQLTAEADALLFLSLISGRNPEYLIGHHVTAAPRIRELQLEVIPTGYLLVDGGTPTTASYMSGTLPIPHNKPDIAAATALAGTYLGLQALYLDTGSGAQQAVSPAMVQAVAQTTEVPLIVGGGIRTPEMARQLAQAGATLIVVGQGFEDNPAAVAQFSDAIHHAHQR